MQVLGQRVRLPVAAPFLFVFQAASAMREDSYGRRAVDLEKVLDGSRILLSIGVRLVCRHFPWTGADDAVLRLHHASMVN